ncbi:MAG: adenine deaminase [Candidatus Dormibacteraeota bacterium]|nr:adenine deaminase [Candidatus Dormibacteraeota bacterium]MBO0743692.1 adenine deaminase [Candidatus Dormibacteraeota bacterium]
MERIDARWLQVARGEAPADLVVTGGRVFNVFTGEWMETEVAIADGHVVGLGEGYQGGRRLDVDGHHVVPGFIDAHMHLESSKLLVDQFARTVVPRGTTTVVVDPHEIANVLGTDGVHWLLDQCRDLPLAVYMMAPSSVPASPFESPRRPLTQGDLSALLRRRRVLGVAEMMNYPGVVAGDPAELAKLHSDLTGHVDGHAPGLTGKALCAYVAAGIRSDHESTTAAEALEKRRLGMWVLLREASNARNLLDLLPMVRELGPDRCAFCTDDREPDFLVEQGHLDQMLRLAVAHGVRPEAALLMATLHPAQCHGLQDRGAIAPGCWADLVVLEDLRDFRALGVLTRGKEPVYPTLEVPDWVRQTVHLGPVPASVFSVPAPAGTLRVIGVVPGQLLTTEERMEATVHEGRAVADPARDLAKIAVLERHHATGRVGLGFVTHTGLRRGAFASTVAHDAHNLVVVGVDDEDMACCARRLGELGGGIAVAEGGRVMGELALPVAGLMSGRPAEEVAAALARLQEQLRERGVTIPAPFMALSFLALSVIPALKLTDRGLVDVDRRRLVALDTAAG